MYVSAEFEASADQEPPLHGGPWIAPQSHTGSGLQSDLGSSIQSDPGSSLPSYLGFGLQEGDLDSSLQDDFRLQEASGKRPDEQHSLIFRHCEK